jgi:predicted HicB family RNase H-like nuclease
MHQEEIEKLKVTHAQEVTRLKGEQLEINKYNERIEEQVQRLQQDNHLLENIVEERKKKIVVPGDN